MRRTWRWLTPLGADRGPLASREWLAGQRFTIADITAIVGIDFGTAAVRACPSMRA